jgi:hypothetical protein
VLSEQTHKNKNNWLNHIKNIPKAAETFVNYAKHTANINKQTEIIIIFVNIYQISK